ncbi:MAG TPA: DUF5996 family protein [Acidimicrobiia bacterium]|jgi:hypothetical protein
MAIDALPSLPSDLEPTRASLHAYARAVGALPRVHANPHPLWWHTGLALGPTGLTTAQMALPGGGFAAARIDFTSDDVVLATSTGEAGRWSMRRGMTGTEMAEAILASAADLGLEGDYDRERFTNDGPRAYDPEVAAASFTTLLGVRDVFERHLAELPGAVSPIHLWPHGFDLAFDWIGTRTVRSDAGADDSAHPATLNLGFYPEGRAYFYSNPWPFESALGEVALPSGADWHRDGWEGSILYFDQVAGRPGGAADVLAYARAVFEAAAPTLTA